MAETIGPSAELYGKPHRFGNVLMSRRGSRPTIKLSGFFGVSDRLRCNMESLYLFVPRGAVAVSSFWPVVLCNIFWSLLRAGFAMLLWILVNGWNATTKVPVRFDRGYRITAVKAEVWMFSSRIRW